MPQSTTDNILRKNGWNEWEKYVLKSLEELKHCSELQDERIEGNKAEYINAINRLELSFVEKMAELTSDINIIKTKITQRATLTGFIAGFLPALATLIWTKLR